ncbi:MAG: type II secretion system protein [Fibrobacter sp.]|nr:type II secretion system protein [Fibrobacter sp.]
MKYNATKGGFTLIELMVVIVIMGILAAVAVPKLFGLMAKAKTSELYSSAGSYIHLQDTFNTEYHDSIGTWKAIGYTMLSNDIFKYYEGNSEGGIATVSAVSIDVGKTAAWKANNINKLGECEADNVWQLNISKSPTTEYNILYQVVISADACEALTTKFGSLDTYNKITTTP